MGRIATTFRRLQKANEAAFIPYLTIGIPSLDATRQLLPVMGRQGADLIAFGSSRVPDGSLKSNTTLSDCFHVAAEARRSNEVPLILVSYYAPIYEYGLEEFAADCARSGIDGLMVPDLSEAPLDLATACQQQGIDLIPGVTPSSADEHIKRTAEIANGFIYCELPEADNALVSQEIGDLVARLRQQTDLPLVVGSEFSTPQQVEQATPIVDGVMVGSAFIRLIESLDEEELILGVSDFVRDLKEATHKPTA
jgi:tryptophan synthase alpha chain